MGNVKKVYFDVTTGTKCTIAQWSANNGNTTNLMNSGCLKFYAYMEDDVAYTMILDRSIVSSRQWYGSNNNGVGPVNALSQLKQITDSWQGTITPSNYTRVYAINGSYAAYDINYNTDGYKARLITADEIAHITANDSFDSVTATTDKWFYLDGYAVKDTDPTWHTQIATATRESVFSWLMNYLRNNINFGGTANGTNDLGYWTSDSIAGTTTSAWIVSNSGKLTNGVFQTGSSDRALTVNDMANCGIRPVITVLKSIVD